MVARAGGLEQGYAIAFGARQMDDQLVAVLDYPVLALQFGIDRDQRQRPHQLAASPEFAGGRQAFPVRMCPADRRYREVEGRRGAMQVTALWPTAHFQAAKDLRLKGRTIA